MPAQNEPWERLEEESAKAYEAFVVYRGLGLTRTCAKVAAAVGKSTTLMRRWSSEYSWSVRAAAWDREQDREHLLEQRTARREAEKRNARLANVAFSAAAARLVQLANDPAQIKAGDVARLVEAAMKLEQYALGVPTERVKVEATVDGTVDVALEGLTDEELRLRMRELLAQVSGDLRDWDRETGLLVEGEGVDLDELT